MSQKTQPSTSSSTTSSSSSPLSINTLHHRFTFYGRSAREWTRKCALLLPEIERERVWEKKGFGSVYEYAGKLAGMSRESVNDALRVLRATEGMNEIRDVIAQRGINSVKPVITALTKDNASFWAEKIKIMSRHTLETYVREMRSQESIAQELMASGDTTQNEASCATQNIAPAGRTGPSKNLDLPLQQVIVMQLDPEIASELEKLKGQNGDWNSLMKEFLQMRNAEIEREAREIQADIRAAQEAQKTPQEQLAQKTPTASRTPEPQSTPRPTSQPVSRHIPAKIRRHVINKTRGQCAYPSCTKQYKILHHTQRFALNRVHDPDKITPLCTAHERIVHNGLIENEDGPTQRWRVRAQADERDPRYAIDQKVQRFRVPK